MSILDWVERARKLLPRGNGKHGSEMEKKEKKVPESEAYGALQVLGAYLKGRDTDEMQCLSGRLSMALAEDTFEVTIFRKPHQPFVPKSATSPIPPGSQRTS